MKNKYENKNQERDFKGVWIKKEIWLDYDLNACEKVLLVEIDSLDNEPHHCFAKNEYFAKFLGVSSRTVTRYIAHLEQLGYIYVKDKSKYKKKDYDRIIISLLSKFIKPKEVKLQDIDKMSNPPRQNVEMGTTNCLNNNINNNLINNIKDLDLSLPIFDSPKRKKEYKLILKQLNSLNCTRESMIKLWNKIAENGFKDPEGRPIKNMAGYMINILSKNPHLKTKSVAKFPDYNKLAEKYNKKIMLKQAKEAIERRKQKRRENQQNVHKNEKEMDWHSFEEGLI